MSGYSNYGLRLFSGDNLNYSIYQTLKSTVSDIAAGNQTSTQITIDLSDYGLTYTTDDLDVTASSYTTELESLGKAKFQETLLYSKIVYCLIADSPYDMYWFDKGTNGYTVSYSYNYGGTVNSAGEATYTYIQFNSITFKFSVISAYQDSSASEPQYTLNTSMVSTAQAAASNAQEIVEKYADSSDAEKLEAYKEEICALVTYNSEAASEDYDEGYGDPWGLVYVFDGDDSTNVVCEGYSKAFQYLCDQGLTDAVCYTVSGIMTGGTGAGAHMWNIVTLNGSNYLVDVTNSDDGTIGKDGGLFLVNENDATSTTYDSAGFPIYTFTVNGTEITYAYGDSTENLYADMGILTLTAASDEGTEDSGETGDSGETEDVDESGDSGETEDDGETEDSDVTGDDDESGDGSETGDLTEQFSNATELTTNGASATISEAGTYVYFKIIPEETGTYYIYSGGNMDTYGYLYDADGNCLFQDDDSAGNGNNFAITYRLTEGNTYYLGVRFYSNSITGTFSLYMERTSGLSLSYDSNVALEVGDEGTLSVTATNDYEDTDFTYSWYKYNENTYTYDLIDGETGNTLTVTEKGTYKCIVDDNSMTATAWFYVTVNSGLSASADQYYYTVSQGDTVSLAVTADTEKGELSYKWYRYDGDGYTLLENTDSTLTITPDQSAEYYCVVSDTYNTATVWFTVYVAGTTATSKEDAVKLTAGTPALATISSYGDSMYFIITPDATDTYVFYSSCGYYVYGYLYDENGNELASGYANNNGNFRFTYELTASETYYLAVTSGSGAPISFQVYMDTYVDANLQFVDGGNTYYAYSEAGEGVELTVDGKISVAEGTELTYQWYKDGSKIDGATGSTFTTDEINSRIYYNCKVQDKYGNYLYFYFIVTVDTGLSIDGGNWHEYSIEEPGTQQLTLTTSATANEGIELTYEWYCYDYLTYETTTISENDDSITVTPTSRSEYYCRISDNYGNSVYDYFDVYIETGLTADTTWFEYEVELNSSQTLSAESVTANEGVALTYQWYQDWEEIEEATGNSYTVVSVSSYQEYECRVSDSYGNRITLYFYISVDTGLSINGDDWNYTHYYDTEPGTELTLTTAATANEGVELTYTWYCYDYLTYKTTTISENGDSITVTPTSRCEYYCRISDDYGNSVYDYFVIYIATSMTAEETWFEYKVEAGESQVLSAECVTADASEDLTYQWYKDWDILEGETGVTYTVNNITAYSNYQCEVSDSYGNRITLYFYVSVDTGLSINGDNWHEYSIEEPGTELTLTTSATAYDGIELTYNWYCYDYLTYKTTTISGNGNSITVTPTSRCEYYCRISDNYGSSVYEYFDVSIATGLTAGTTWFEYEVELNSSQTLSAESVTVNEGIDLTYQWYCDDEVLEDETGVTYTVENVTTYGYYRCRVRDNYGNSVNLYFELYIDNNLSITYSSDVTVDYGESATLAVTVTANDTDGITCSWYGYDYLNYDYTDYEETGSSLTLEDVTASGYYHCTVTDQYGNRKYAYFYVTVDTGLTTVNHGYSKTVSPGDSLTLTTDEATANEGVTLTYQWYKDGEIIDGATSASYELTNITMAGYYTCWISDGCGNSVRFSYDVSIENGFTVNTDSTSIYVLSGGSAEYTVEASADSGEISYQWYKYNSDEWTYEALDGETGATLTLTDITEDADYRCTVSDVYGNTGNVYLYIYITETLRVNSNGSYSVTPDGTVTISVDPVTPNTDSLTYQWYKGSMESYYSGWTYEIIEGATGQEYVVSGADVPSMGYQYYRCVVSDGDSTVDAYVYVEMDSGLRTSFDSDSSYTVTPGEEVTFKTSATTDMGEDTLTFHWYLVTGDSDDTEAYTEITDGITTSGGTSGLTVEATERSTYMCAVSDGYDTNRMWFYLYIDSGFSAVLDQANSQTISVGDSVTLSVTATSDYSESLSYQWYYLDEVDYIGTLLDGETANTLTVANPKTGGYYCVVRDGYNYAYLYYWITVNSGLSVSYDQPTYNTVRLGETIELSVTAETSAGTLTYQWQEQTDGTYVDISGETASSMTVKGDAIIGEYNRYRCLVSDGYTSEAVYTYVYVIGDTAEDQESAVALTAGSSATASIETPGSEMYFKITPETSGSYTFSSDTGYTTKATLYDADMTKLKYSDGYSAEDNSFHITCDLEAGKTYYLVCGFYYSYSLYRGTFTVTMEAEGASIAAATVSLSTDSYVYDGTAKEPAVTVTYNGTVLTEGTDYTVSYTDNVNAGTATVTVKGMGEYIGTVTKTFEIGQASQTVTASAGNSEITYGATTSLTVTGEGDVTYKSSNEAVAVVSAEGVVTAVGVGTAYITVTASGDDNYKAGSASVAITVSAASINNCAVSVETSEFTYDGEAKEPAVTVTDGEMTLTADTDYIVAYSDNTNAGTATVTVTGMGNYTGTATTTFTIAKAEQTLTVPESLAVVLNKTAQISVETDATDTVTYTYESSDTSIVTVDENGTVTGVGEGTTTITITAAETTNYQSATATITVVVASNVITLTADNTSVTVDSADLVYTGTAQEPAVTVVYTQDDQSVTLTKGTDYTVEYTNNVNAGTATVTITIIGESYTGESLTANFTIAKAEQILTVPETVSVVAGNTAQLTPSTTATEDVTFSYASADTSVATVDESGVITGVAAGTTTITVTAVETANYKSASAEVTVVVAAGVTELTAENTSVSLAETEFVYDGTVKEPEVTVVCGEVTLIQGTDYTVAYTDNTNAGTATVTITGTGNSYSGELTATFTIAKAEQKLTAEMESTTLAYGQTATITVSGAEGALTYVSSNESAATVDANGLVTAVATGTAQITVSAAATDNYNAAEATVSLTVISAVIDDCEITLDKESYTYNGEAQTPTVTVTYGTYTLTEGLDYTLTWGNANSTEVGEYTVTMTGINNFSDTVKKTYSIGKAAQMISGTTSYLKTYGAGTFALDAKRVTGDGALTYASSDTSVVTVDETGKVTIKGAGTATITVTAKGTDNYEQAEKTIAITVAKASQTISGTASYTKTYGDGTFTLDAKRTAGDGALTYTSSKTSVVTVDETGKVTIKGAGTATITVTAAETDNYAEAEKSIVMTVNQADISGYTATLSAANYNWTGSEITPTVTVKNGSTTLTKNTDYTVSYASGRKNLGTYNVTITGAGNYKGTITKSFTISAAKDETYTVGSYKYKVTSATASTTSGTGTVTITGGTKTTLTSIKVADTVTIGGRTYKVTAVGSGAFKSYTKATSISIGKYVTSIGSKAFYGCTKAKSVSVGSKVTSIGSSAFYKCTALTKVTGCSAVTSVGSSAFQSCSKLATVAGLQKATSIGSKAFYGCTKLKTIGSTSGRITLAKVKTIGSSAFYKCTTFTYVNLTSTALTKIDASAFQGCTALKTFVSKSTKLTTIGKKAFYGDKKLASVTLKTTKLTSSKVGASAFKGIKSTCTFKVPSAKVSAYKKIFTAKGAGSKITVKKG
ncbi:MAG: leucine-rich repeat protein [Lachnospiraceae bacterium]|nr:leucine-rich repeat protein [Lachnospiraceae bacterium]